MITVCKYEELPVDILAVITDYANVFFQKIYVDFVRANGEEVYYCYNEDRIVTIRYRNKMIFKLGVMPSEPFEIKNAVKEELSTYLDEVMYVIERKLGVQWINTTASALFMDTPTHKCKRIPFGSHVIDLDLDEEILWKNVHSKHRNVIRKAQKEGVTIEVGGENLLSDYVELEQETSKRTGRNASGYNYYLKQIKSLQKNIKVYIAYYNGIPQAGGIFYVNRACCYYMYGATKRDAVTGAANFLLWSAIKKAKEIGVKEFSFVGCRINEDPNSKYHGIQRFKERFGGELVVGYMFRYESKPYMYKLFCKAMQIRLHSKVVYKDPIDEEIYKWTNEQVN